MQGARSTRSIGRRRVCAGTDSSASRRLRSIQWKAGLADVDLEDLPRIGVIGRLKVAVGDQERIALEGKAPRRVEAWIRDAIDLVPGGIENRDLVRTDEADIQVARLGEGKTGRLR